MIFVLQTWATLITLEKEASSVFKGVGERDAVSLAIKASLSLVYFEGEMHAVKSIFLILCEMFLLVKTKQVNPDLLHLHVAYLILQDTLIDM